MFDLALTLMDSVNQRNRLVYINYALWGGKLGGDFGGFDWLALPFCRGKSGWRAFFIPLP
jgi:hypothetical protein